MKLPEFDTVEFILEKGEVQLQRIFVNILGPKLVVTAVIGEDFSRNDFFVHYDNQKFAAQ